MKKDDIRPYLLPPNDAITASDWIRIVDGKPEPLAEYLADWDQNTQLQVQSSIEANIERISASTDLPAHALRWAVGWRAIDTGLLGTTQVYAVQGDLVEVELIIPSSLTGNVIQLTRRLILASSTTMAGSPLRARIPGSVLWSDETVCRLSGIGTAFPVEIVDFSKVSSLARLARNSWYLELPASVDQPVLGGMLLMINDADTTLAPAVIAARPNDSQQAVIQGMQESVVEQVVLWALARWEDLPESNDTSVGSVAKLLTERVLVDPDSWTSTDVDPMELHAAIVEGARRLGLGRKLL